MAKSNEASIPIWTTSNPEILAKQLDERQKEPLLTIAAPKLARGSLHQGQFRVVSVGYRSSSGSREPITGAENPLMIKSAAIERHQERPQTRQSPRPKNIAAR